MLLSCLLHSLANIANCEHDQCSLINREGCKHENLIFHAALTDFLFMQSYLHHSLANTAQWHHIMTLECSHLKL